MAEPYTLENALLEQLDQLIDSPWADCLAVATDGPSSQGLPKSAPLPSVGSGSYRQLAPAPGADGSARTARARPQRQAVPPSAPEPLREQDRLLPMANVARLMASELPKDAKISRDAKVLMQEMVSEFICFVTAEANDFSIADNHKAITQEDHLSALESLGTQQDPSNPRSRSDF